VIKKGEEMNMLVTMSLTLGVMFLITTGFQFLTQIGITGRKTENLLRNQGFSSISILSRKWFFASLRGSGGNSVLFVVSAINSAGQPATIKVGESWFSAAIVG
jgi:hypothetical protein